MSRSNLCDIFFERPRGSDGTSELGSVLNGQSLYFYFLFRTNISENAAYQYIGQNNDNVW